MTEQAPAGFVWQPVTWSREQRVAGASKTANKESSSRRAGAVFGKVAVGEE